MLQNKDARRRPSGRRRGVGHAGAPAIAAAGLVPLIQEIGVLFSRPLALIGADPGGTIPDRASEKRAPVPPDAVAAALDDR